MAINSVMIWYAYAEEIGGKHLRSMIREAMVEGVTEIPADSGVVYSWTILFPV